MTLAVPLRIQVVSTVGVATGGRGGWEANSLLLHVLVLLQLQHRCDEEQKQGGSVAPIYLAEIERKENRVRAKRATVKPPRAGPETGPLTVANVVVCLNCNSCWSKRGHVKGSTWQQHRVARVAVQLQSQGKRASSSDPPRPPDPRIVVWHLDSAE